MSAQPVERTALSEIVRRNVRAETARRGWDQARVASILGITPPAVSQRFTGRTRWSIDELDAVAVAMGIPLMRLLEDSEAPTPAITGGGAYFLPLGEASCANRDLNPEPAD